MIGPFGVRRGLDWGGSCESSVVSRRLGGAVVTFSLPGAAAVVFRKTSASAGARRRRDSVRRRHGPRGARASATGRSAGCWGRGSERLSRFRPASGAPERP